MGLLYAGCSNHDDAGQTLNQPAPANTQSLQYIDQLGTFLVMNSDGTPDISFIYLYNNDFRSLTEKLVNADYTDPVNLIAAAEFLARRAEISRDIVQLSAFMVTQNYELMMQDRQFTRPLEKLSAWEVIEAYLHLNDIGNAKAVFSEFSNVAGNEPYSSVESGEKLIRAIESQPIKINPVTWLYHNTFRENPMNDTRDYLKKYIAALNQIYLSPVTTEAFVKYFSLKFLRRKLA